MDRLLFISFYPLCRKAVCLVLFSCWKRTAYSPIRKSVGWNFLWISGIRCLCKWQVSGKTFQKGRNGRGQNASVDPLLPSLAINGNKREKTGNQVNAINKQ